MYLKSCIVGNSGDKTCVLWYGKISIIRYYKFGDFNAKNVIKANDHNERGGACHWSHM